MKATKKRSRERSLENSITPPYLEKRRPDRGSRRREDFARKRKNFLPTLLLALAGWAGWAGYVWWVSPANGMRISWFLVLVFNAVFLTASLLWANSRRGFLTAIGITGFLLFRYHDIANLLNVFILLSLLVSVELYFVQRR